MAAELVDRRTRDATIRRLAAEGWSTREIARHVGLTQQRIVQILAERPDRETLIAEAERRLVAELRTLLEVREAATARIAAIRSQLRRLEEEREALRIDRLLGLDR
jgi:transcriptional regulator with XRE-family HTH domain